MALEVPAAVAVAAAATTLHSASVKHESMEDTRERHSHVTHTPAMEQYNSASKTKQNKNILSDSKQKWSRRQKRRRASNVLFWNMDGKETGKT